MVEVLPYTSFHRKEKISKWSTTLEDRPLLTASSASHRRASIAKTRNSIKTTCITHTTTLIFKQPEASRRHALSFEVGERPVASTVLLWVAKSLKAKVVCDAHKLAVVNMALDSNLDAGNVTSRNSGRCIDFCEQPLHSEVGMDDECEVSRKGRGGGTSNADWRMTLFSNEGSNLTN
ncbi:uncharacterized protein ARMOST_01548 [Armillaria ostoyae]|uniref:Uncharacterized protein n=1 Tax=Armillaria ostoyae TaxID=47428 RepID=A0A284QP99_ARMOS|nr:uncharacterized protein ARMOST_01548 [Armillaria ostoyae]